VGPPKQKPPSRSVFVLFLRLFEKHALLERGVELHKFNLTFYALLILPGPDDMAGLGGLEPEQAIL